MSEKYLARVEASPYFKQAQNDVLSSWCLTIEASCWFRSFTALASDVVFAIEYSDSLRHYCLDIDKLNATYFQDSLLSGRVTLRGFGDLKAARLIVKSAAEIECLDVSFKEAQPSHQRYKLVA